MTSDEIPDGLFLEPVFMPEGDPDDFEALQEKFESAGEEPDGGFATDLFSGALNSAARIDMYRSWLYPDLYPNERGAVLQNWSPEDKTMYCGIYGE